MSGRILRNALMSLLAAGLCAGVACDNWLSRPTLFDNTVRVVATRRNGEPVAGVPLVIYTGQRPMGYATTDSAGKHEFRKLPQDLYGVIATIPPGYDVIEHLVSGPVSTTRDDIRLTGGDSTHVVNFTFLKKGPGTVVARVLNTDGSPIAATPVELYSPQATVARLVTDQSGLVTFKNVPFGVYGIVVIRPPYYRDFVRPSDSLYSYRDNLIVEEGSRDSLAVPIARCIGSVRVTVVDGSGAAVPLSTIAFFTSTSTLGVAATGPDGRVTFNNGPCGTQLGVNVNPAPGYFAPPGRGTSFSDGIVLTNGQTADVIIRVQKTP